VSGLERAEVFHELSRVLRDHADELAEVMTREGGKPFVENRDEVTWVAACFDYYGEIARDSVGYLPAPIEPQQLALVVKEPVGVVACIVPWNFPLLLAAWKVAPALAAGNSVLLKPSEETPLATRRMIELMDNLPDGVLQGVYGAGSVGDALVRHPGVDMVAFTGSQATGRKVAHVAADRLIRANLELGGKDPFIICDDVDIEIEADRVVDATGVWTARPDAPLGGGARVLPSKGAHLVVRRDRIPSRTGLTIRVPGKIVFLVPWPGHWLIGTTDAAYDGPVDRPAATADDVDELLDAVNRTLDVDLARSDVLGTYAGLRPLAVSGSSGSTVKASREHRVTTEPNGLVRVTGGKYTTYRVMAQDAIDAALGRDEARRRPSATAELALVGALPRPELDALASRLVVTDGLDGAVAARLVARHGSEAREVVALGKERGLLKRLAPDVEHLEAEVAWAARNELALSLEDILARRTRLAQERPDRAASMAPRAAEILGGELGWSGERRSAEVTAFLAAARREFDVPAATERVVATAPAAEPA